MHSGILPPNMDGPNGMEQTSNTNRQQPQHITRMPFRNGPIPGMGKKVKTSGEDGKLKEPIALVINDNFEVKIHQNVKPGTLTVKTKGKDIAVLIPSSKILSFEWGNESIRGWIVDVKNAVALPSDTKIDSEEVDSVIDAMQTNYKNYKTRQNTATIETAGKWIVIGIAVIIGLIIVAGIFGVDIGATFK